MRGPQRRSYDLLDDRVHCLTPCITTQTLYTVKNVTMREPQRSENHSRKTPTEGHRL